MKNKHIINLHADDESMNNDIEKLNHKLYLEAQAHNEELKDTMLVAKAYIEIGTKILCTFMDKESYKCLMNNIRNLSFHSLTLRRFKDKTQY